MKITSWFDGKTIFEANVKTMKELVELAVATGISLQGANLWGANLWEANLREANLQGADLQWTYLRGADLLGTRFDPS